MSFDIPYDYLYRVLQPTEDPKVGIVAASPFSSASVSQHVGCGGLATQYISTCSTEYSATNFANLGLAHGDISPKRIVTIDVALLKIANPRVVFYDLTNVFTRDKYISDNSTANRWASHWDEVLIEGRVPASCIIKVQEVSR